MAQIQILATEVADKIAAGEVVERPAAAVKELVENAIDAGADRIRVEIKNGGMKYICVEDNGKGIPREELEFAFLRHATSKLREIEDLTRIQTMGFRGEALASICAVAEVKVISRTKSEEEGTFMTLIHGKPSDKSSVACNFGTTMTVENLFANVPARMKFMKKDSTESGYVTDVVGRIALANPDIAIKYICDGKEIFSTSGDGRLKNSILNIYGIDHAKAVFEVDYTEHGVHIYGAVGKAELARGNRTRQTLIVNGRYIKSHVVAKVVEEAYRNVLMNGRFPFFVLNIDLEPSLVDVNVHPAKTEIKFANEKEVYNIVHCAVKNALYVQNTGEQEPKEASPQNNNEHKKPYSLRYEPVKAADTNLIKEFIKNTIPAEKTKEEDPLADISFKAPTTQNNGYWNKKEPDFSKSDFEKSISEKGAPQDKTSAEKLEMPQKAMAKEPLPEAEPKMEKTKTDLFGQEIDDSSAALPKATKRIVGQVFETYIVVQKGDEMYLIDQHAAHERKRFEMLKKDYSEKKKCGQLLLSPIVLEVEPLELQAIKENSSLLDDIGFSMEEFGRNTVIIRETPLIGDEEEIRSLAYEVVSLLCDGRPLGMLSFEERLLDMISCKYAIKANKHLTTIEMEALVSDTEVLESRGITTCPHGRPIKISFSKREIEKLFKRIV